MAAKKKVTKKATKTTPRISPKLPQTPVQKRTYYYHLNNGDCFLYADRLWMKSDYDYQEAINLSNGDTAYDMCEDVVIPVDIKITWKKK
jgi:hypothetical protein